ncbi:MAG: cation:proton antiporter [Muribaculaceae bacterium]|nr:cation:proton antiporter [Muribaculaceae bacterium]
MHIESLIQDLAFILLLGAVVTVLFKWIKQPVVLGYIVAGFLASPNFTYLPSVTTAENIQFWAEIGIVVLLFSLGLEFSFKKLVNSGASAIVTALIIVTGMMAAGVLIGHLMGFTFINCLFLGGMLSMSSTTIIIKAFTDLGLRQHKFASQVLAVLIVEDLFAVVMMVILSSIATSHSVEGGELVFSIAKLVFFLVIWFLVGVYVLPSALNRIQRYLNPETLLIISMGLCLGMAVFSVYCGFSLALGAFVMGSILAGTIYAERIESVVTPVKDLFGSVFFISVGMMVQPDIVVEYWPMILILSATVIVGMIVFGTFGMLVTGQTLKVAIQSGFSLTQIGEFAFIIATLGMSLKVLDASMYPIVVAVSVLTTFTTPYFIKMSLPFYNLVERHLPAQLQFLITRYHSTAAREEAHKRNMWSQAVKTQLSRSLMYAVVLVAIAIVSHMYLMPWLGGFSERYGKAIGLVATLVAMSPFLGAMVVPLARVLLARYAGTRKKYNVAQIVMAVISFLMALLILVNIITSVYSMAWGLSIGLTLVLLVVMLFSQRLRRQMTEIEQRFIENLNERDLRRSGKNNNIVNDLHMAYMTVGPGCEFAGERLKNSNVRKKFGVNIVSVQRDQQTITVPSGERRIFPGDVLGVIGTDEQIANVLPVIERSREAMPDEAAPSDFKLVRIQLTEASPLVGKSPRNSGLRDRYDSLVLAVQRDEEYTDQDPDMIFEAGDILWLVGSEKVLNSLQ